MGCRTLSNILSVLATVVLRVFQNNSALTWTVKIVKFSGRETITGLNIDKVPFRVRVSRYSSADRRTS